MAHMFIVYLLYTADIGEQRGMPQGFFVVFGQNWAPFLNGK